MAVQIQFRRGASAAWASANPVLADGELGLDTTSYTYKIGNGASTWTQLPYQSLPASTLSSAVYTAKGTIAAASAANSPVAVTVGANNTLLVADSAQTAGVKWASTLSGLTLTSPTINTPTITAPNITGAASIGSGATLTSPTVNTPVTNGTATNLTLFSPKEGWTTSASAIPVTATIDVMTATNVYYTGSASANWTFNFRGNGSTAASAYLGVGQSTTVGVLVTNGASAYYPTAFQIDGAAVTPKWQNGVAPTAGNANSVDAYLFTIVKTAATPTPTYTVFASQTKFA